MNMRTLYILNFKLPLFTDNLQFLSPEYCFVWAEDSCRVSFSSMNLKKLSAEIP